MIVNPVKILSFNVFLIIIFQDFILYFTNGLTVLFDSLQFVNETIFIYFFLDFNEVYTNLELIFEIKNPGILDNRQT